MTNVDQELQRALEVEPSPEFLARVRMRIADEPSPRRWGFTWVFAAAAAAAAVIVAVVLTRSAGEQQQSVVLLASRTLPTFEVPTIVGRPLTAASNDGGPEGPPYTRRDNPAAGGAGVGRPFRAASNHDTPERAPEILVDARESSALRRLMAAVGARRIDLRAVLKPGPFAIADAEPISEIEIKPISIDPLEATSEGARE